MALCNEGMKEGEEDHLHVKEGGGGSSTCKGGGRRIIYM